MENLPEKKHFLFSSGFIYENEDGLTRWLKSISLLSAVIAVLIFVDYFLPLKEREYRVKETIVRVGFSDIDYSTFLKLKIRGGEEEFWIIMDGEEMAVSEKVLARQKKGDTIVVYKTMIFGINVKFQNKRMIDSGYDYPFINVYGVFIFFPFIFLLLFTFLFFFRKKTEVILTVGVITILLLAGFGFLLLFY